MDSCEIVYQDSLSELQAAIEVELDKYIIDEEDFLYEIESNLDGWDYCFSIAIGMLGVFLSTNERLGKYLEDIHKAASGASGQYSSLQKLLGDLLHHAGDDIDQIDGKFVNRNGENAWGLFHRLLWGHDVVGSKDNPFSLMYKQKGIAGIIQAMRHLLADTMSHQGLPLPGSSYLDYEYEKNGAKKLSNYLIDISKKLSSNNDNVEAEKIYSRLFTIRAQDIVGTASSKILSEVYLRARGITDEIRKTQFRLIAFSINFFGEALYGSIRQKGVPYINITIGIMTGKELARLLFISNKDTKALQMRTNQIVEDNIALENSTLARKELLSMGRPEDCVNELDKADENIDSFILYLAEDK